MKNMGIHLKSEGFAIMARKKSNRNYASKMDFSISCTTVQLTRSQLGEKKDG